MERREFVQRGATLAGGAALLGLTPTEADAGHPRERQREIPPELAPSPLQSRLSDAPAPISESERTQRREKAQRLMKDLGYSAMLIEPGPNMLYFLGVDWGRSERLFAFIGRRDIGITRACHHDAARMYAHAIERAHEARDGWEPLERVAVQRTIDCLANA